MLANRDRTTPVQKPRGSPCAKRLSDPFRGQTPRLAKLRATSHDGQPRHHHPSHRGLHQPDLAVTVNTTHGDDALSRTLLPTSHTYRHTSAACQEPSRPCMSQQAQQARLRLQSIPRPDARSPAAAACMPRSAPTTLPARHPGGALPSLFPAYLPAPAARARQRAPGPPVCARRCRLSSSAGAAGGTRAGRPGARLAAPPPPRPRPAPWVARRDRQQAPWLGTASGLCAARLGRTAAAA